MLPPGDRGAQHLLQALDHAVPPEAERRGARGRTQTSASVTVVRGAQRLADETRRIPERHAQAIATGFDQL
jgi:hypothetical protein